MGLKSFDLMCYSAGLYKFEMAQNSVKVGKNNCGDLLRVVL